MDIDRNRDYSKVVAKLQEFSLPFIDNKDNMCSVQELEEVVTEIKNDCEKYLKFLRNN